VIGCRSAACSIRSSQPSARSAKGSASRPRLSGSRRSRNADRSTSGLGPPVRRLSLFLHDFTAWFSHDFRKVALKAARVSALRFQFHFGLQ
jgi:hypothetical protein